MATQKLKCGGLSKGKKKKHMATGGPTPISVSNIKMPTLAPKINTTTLAPGPKMPAGSSISGMDVSPMMFVQAGDIVGNYLDELITANADKEMDWRENPITQMRKNNRKHTAGDISKNTVKGAGTGAAIGTFLLPGIGTGVGAAIGAGIGALTTGVKKLLTSKKKKTAMKTAENNWISGMGRDANEAVVRSGYKNGGRKGSKKFASGGINATSIMSMIGNQLETTPDKPYVKGDKYYDDLTKGRETTKSITNVTDIIPGASVSRKSSTIAADLISGKKDEYGVYKSSDAQVALAGFSDPLRGVEQTIGDIQAGTVSWKNALDILVPGVGSVIRNYDAKDERARVKAIPAGKETLAALNTRGYKKGGAIEGKGTGKSDSIDMKAPDGAFIVPAENADIAEEIGRSFLGWDKDEKAKRNNGGTSIKVSNGEVYFDPEEVKILKYHKINLDELAPNAENSVNMKKGGEKNTKKQESSWTHDKDQDLVINDATKTAYDKSGAEYVFNIDENKYVKLKSGSPYGIDIYNQATKGPDKDKPEWMKNLPEIAGAIQAGAGAVGLAKAGKAPNLSVSRALTGLSAELRKEAEYGLEPGAKSAMLNQTERARRNTTNAIINRGGSALDVMSNLQTMLGTTIDKNYNIEIADAAEKARKKGLYYNTRAKIGDQEFDIAKINLDEYYKNQEMFAGLVSAGISNIVGARQLKTEQDTLKEIGGNRPTWKS